MLDMQRGSSSEEIPQFDAEGLVELINDERQLRNISARTKPSMMSRTFLDTVLKFKLTNERGRRGPCNQLTILFELALQYTHGSAF